MRSGMMLDYAEAQIQGGRSYQEDTCAAQLGDPAAPLSTGGLGPMPTDTAILVLADGMGGENAGDRASRIAVAAFMRAYQAGAMTTDVGKRLRVALEEANRAIAEQVEQDPALKGMGCTLLALAVAAGRAYFISVGDSPLWRYRAGRAQRLNADHSMGGVLDEVARRGDISVQMARSSPNRHVLLSALTGEPIEHISETDGTLPLQTGDCFLLASDGLLTLSDKARDAIMTRFNESAAARVNALLAEVTAQGRQEQDNTSVQVLCCVRCRASGRRGLGLVLGLLAVIIAASIIAASIVFFLT